MTEKTTVATSLCTYDESTIHVRGFNLCEDLIGKVTFTEMMFLDVFGRLPSKTETAVLNAMMVTLMEHGLAPSAISTRLTYSSAPEAIQGAIAAGLLSAGTAMLGTLGSSARLLSKLVDDPDGVEPAARREVLKYRERAIPVPGFGHPHHKPDDPRTLRLFALAEELELEGRYVAACRVLGDVVDETYGKHLTVNASAAMGALLCEINIPTELMQGFAVVCRSAGLLAHVYEEMRSPTAWVMSAAAAKSVAYVDPNQSDAIGFCIGDTT